MLKIEKLEVQIKDKKILKNIDFDIQLGKNYCILGQNGSGKTSLALSIMGHPEYTITNGKIIVANKDLNIDVTKLSPDKRANLGIFLAFQQIPEIVGVKLFEFLRNIYNTKFEKNLGFIKFKELILPFMDEINLDREFLRRDLNVGFSGGERRKLEILQIKLLKPKYIFLDEVDSGLDVDAFKSINKMLKELDNSENSFIFITHHFEILQNIKIDEAIVLDQGQIKEKGGSELVEKIKKIGFKI